MWEAWFAISFASFCTAAYFLKKRGEFRYQKNEAVYSTKTDDAGYLGRHADTVPIDAQYSVGAPSGAQPPPSSFFSEMSGAVQEQKTGETASPQISADSDSEERQKFRNLRFFDS